MTRAPSPTANDLKLWRGLIAKAEHCAAKPLSDPQALFRQAQRCRKARMPVGHQGRESVFMRLLAFCDTWWRLTEHPVVGGRADRAGELAGLAAACKKALEPSAPAPDRRHRADIDG